MLKIKNIEQLVGTKLHTTHAKWYVMDMEERKNEYAINVRFNYGITPGVKHPKSVLFKLLRYNTFDEQKEWRMYNDQNTNYVTLTKGLLSLKMFVGMLGGQLEDCCIKN